MIEIRRLRKSDIDAVLALRLQVLSPKYNIAETTDLVRSWISRYSENPLAKALVAVERQACIAYLLCDILTHPTMSGVSAMIEEVCVAETYRRQGLGRRLVIEARQQLVSTVEDLTTIRARVDREDERAIAFLSAIGFEQHVIEFTDYLADQK